MIKIISSLALVLILSSFVILRNTGWERYYYYNQQLSVKFPSSPYENNNATTWKSYSCQADSIVLTFGFGPFSYLETNFTDTLEMMMQHSLATLSQSKSNKIDTTSGILIGSTKAKEIKYLLTEEGKTKEIRYIALLLHKSTVVGFYINALTKNPAKISEIKNTFYNSFCTGRCQ